MAKALNNELPTPAGRDTSGWTFFAAAEARADGFYLSDLIMIDRCKYRDRKV